MDIVKILSLCLITAVLCLSLKQHRIDFAVLLSIAGGILILIWLLKSILGPITALEQKIQGYGIDSDYFKIAVKALGIGYITSFIADSCRDAGQASLALKAELAGKCAIFILSVPLMLSILETALGFIK